jgi:hypothetical protein
LVEYSISEAAAAVGRSVWTLRRWERSGRIGPVNRRGGRRSFTEADLARLRQLVNKDHVVEPGEIREPATVSWSRLEDPEPLATPWGELQDDEPVWGGTHGRDDHGQPLPVGPTCGCGRAAHFINDQYGQLVWVCPAHGLVQRPVFVPSLETSVEMVSFVPPVAGPPRRRGLREGDVTGAIRAQKPKPQPNTKYLDPLLPSTTPRQ